MKIMKKTRLKIVVICFTALLCAGIAYIDINKTGTKLSIPSSVPVTSAWQDGGLIIMNNTDLQAANTEGGADGSSSNPWVIQDLMINATNGVGISVLNATDYFVIRNCTIMNASIGINLRNCSNGTVFNNTIYDCSDKGIYLDGCNAAFEYGCHDMNVTKNHIYNIHGTVDNTGNGIELDWWCENNWIENNTIHGVRGGGSYSGHGIFMEGFDFSSNDVRNTTIIGNIIYNNSISTGAIPGSGICLDSECYDTVISNNTIYNQSTDPILGGNGIYVTYSSNNGIDIIENTIYNCWSGDQGLSGVGIYFLQGAQNVLIENNTIYNCTASDDWGQISGMGIYLNGMQNCEVRNNTITNITGGAGYIGGNGIQLDNCQDVTVVDNNVSDIVAGTNNTSGIGILIDQTCDHVNIIDNTITSMIGTLEIETGVGILVEGDHTNVTGNTVRNCSGLYAHGIQIGIGSYNNITYNDIRYCDHEAVFIDFADHNIVTNNGFHFNNQDFLGWGPPEPMRVWGIIFNTTLAPNDWTPVAIYLYQPEESTATEGNTYIYWSNLSWADYYLVYKANGLITEADIPLLTPIANVTNASCYDNNTGTGSACYAVVGKNATLTSKSSPSVCYYFYYGDNGGTDVPGYDLLFLMLAAVGSVALVIRLKRRK